jgi:transcriptional regulator with XRE-family HTH domain
MIMTFGEKLKKLRTENKLTQDELAEKLYVTRTAISKWETDKGYPNIESLKAIACFFSITVDELLSSDEILTIAEEDQKQTQKYFIDLIFGLLDICMVLLFFLPLFATEINDIIQEYSLLTLCGVATYLKVAYFTVVIGTVIVGIMLLVLKNCTSTVWLKSKIKLSLTLSILSAMLFMISLQPYAAVFAFTLFIIKVVLLLRKKEKLK